MSSDCERCRGVCSIMWITWVKYRRFNKEILVKYSFSIKPAEELEFIRQIYPKLQEGGTHVDVCWLVEVMVVGVGAGKRDGKRGRARERGRGRGLFISVVLFCASWAHSGNGRKKAERGRWRRLAGEHERRLREGRDRGRRGEDGRTDGGWVCVSTPLAPQTMNALWSLPATTRHCSRSQRGEHNGRGRTGGGRRGEGLRVGRVCVRAGHVCRARVWHPDLLWPSRWIQEGWAAGGGEVSTLFYLLLSWFPLLFIPTHLSRPSLIPLSLPSFLLLSVIFFLCMFSYFHLFVFPLHLSIFSLSYLLFLTYFPALCSFSSRSPFLFSSFSSPLSFSHPFFCICSFSTLLFLCHPNFSPPPCCHFLLLPAFLSSSVHFFLSCHLYLTSCLLPPLHVFFHFLRLLPAFLPSLLYIFHLSSFLSSSS